MTSDLLSQNQDNFSGFLELDHPLFVCFCPVFSSLLYLSVFNTSHFKFSPTVWPVILNFRQALPSLVAVKCWVCCMSCAIGLLFSIHSQKDLICTCGFTFTLSVYGSDLYFLMSSSLFFSDCFLWYQLIPVYIILPAKAGLKARNDETSLHTGSSLAFFYCGNISKNLGDFWQPSFPFSIFESCFISWVNLKLGPFPFCQYHATIEA